MTFRKGTEKHTMVSAGPLTKYAEDLTPVIKAFLGPEKSLELKIGQEVGIYLISNILYLIKCCIMYYSLSNFYNYHIIIQKYIS